MKYLIINFLIYFSIIGKQPRKMWVYVTAYLRGSNGDDRTATGRSADLPGVAVDPNFIRLGSRITFTSRGISSTYIADDTGKLIKGHRLDLGVRSARVANNFNNRWISIAITPPRKKIKYHGKFNNKSKH